MDTLAPTERSKRMSGIRNRDSAAEMRVRRMVHGLGFRYRLHVAKLPGKPDMVFPRSKTVLFVHGCFWHRHAECALARLPKSRLEFWQPKLEGNRVRDIENRLRLEAAGWRVTEVWECETTRLAALRNTLDQLLGRRDEIC